MLVANGTDMLHPLSVSGCVQQCSEPFRTKGKGFPSQSHDGTWFERCNCPHSFRRHQIAVNSLTLPAALTPGTHPGKDRIVDCVGPGVGQDLLQKISKQSTEESFLKHNSCMITIPLLLFLAPSRGRFSVT
jgi:hypothetical protein